MTPIATIGLMMEILSVAVDEENKPIAANPVRRD
jgi:hypothetical protein